MDLRGIDDYATKNQQAVFIREYLPELVRFLRVEFNMNNDYWLVHLDSLRFRMHFTCHSRFVAVQSIWLENLP